MQPNQILRGDNFDLLETLCQSDTTFDLVLTDPPYNVGQDFGNNTDMQTEEEFRLFMFERADRIYRSLKPEGQAVLFTSQAYVYSVMRAFDSAADFKFRRMMIWHYKNGMSRQTREPVTEFEPILWYSKSDEKWTYNCDDVRVPYKSDRVKNPVYKMNKQGERVAWLPDPRGAKRGDVWEYPTLAGALYKDERTEHPCQKPEILMSDLIRAFCPKGSDGKLEGTVLDPFAGSGTTLVCCERLNRQGHRIKWLGMELEQRWVDVCNARLSRLEEEEEESIL